jgi:hypothetical protein
VKRAQRATDGRGWQVWIVEVTREYRIYGE